MNGRTAATAAAAEEEEERGRDGRDVVSLRREVEEERERESYTVLPTAANNIDRYNVKDY